ncbi:MAG: Bax inhibitor-1/YccA family protein [Alphaproteobacteria bacterium]|nr:Bax inhibitor-1/YccA family protein [Alphaproteobacteria bacterium]
MQENRFGTPTQAASTQINEGLRSHFHRVYGTMALGLLITAVMAYITAGSETLLSLLVGAQSNTMMRLLIAFSPMIVIMMAFNPYTMRKLSAPVLGLIFFAFSAYFGWLMSTMFIAYTAESITRVFFITAATFAAMSVWGYATKSDLSKMGSFLMMAVIGLIIAIVVNMFLQSPMMMYIISGAGVIIYTLMIAFDTQQIKASYNEAYGQENNNKMAIMGALSLYINFIMLFQFLMQFLGQRE